ncbi:MAG: flagellar motor protein MotD [Pseudomonadota bacterium]|jgi:chemotaxis protein MotB|nr:flagellar motor protein MotD [Pseudomonadota bacterium]
MPRRRRPETNLHTDRWMISWADFVTLLFAFFVVMYGVSSVQEEKYRQLAHSLAGVFRAQGGDRVVSPPDGEGVLPERGLQLQPPPVTIAAPDAEQTQALEQLQRQVEEKLRDWIEEGTVKVSGNTLWLAIELNASLLFPSGDALPVIEAEPLLQQIAALIAGRDNPVHVEGFTDDRPISTDRFPSNWELSAARAAAVVRILQQQGVDPARMAAVGYAEFQPAYSNRTAEGRQRNRRLVIVIARDERVRRLVQAFGSQRVSEDAVRALMSAEERRETAESPALEQVETESGILFRQARPEQQQER